MKTVQDLIKWLNENPLPRIGTNLAMKYEEEVREHNSWALRDGYSASRLSNLLSRTANMYHGKYFRTWQSLYRALQRRGL